MSESPQHLRLVRAILTYVGREFPDATALAVFDDTAVSASGERPPRINGYVPDVYAADVPPSMTIIGEAKTRRDLETARSREQIASFLHYLAHRPNGVFVLAVPITAVATARMIVASSRRREDPTTTRVVFLDGMPQGPTQC